MVHGYAIIQRYKQPKTHEPDLASEIHIAVADLGIGIEESLVRCQPELRQRFQRGSQFIQHAFEQGVSGRLTLRGIGLGRVLELVQQWHGSLAIRSNRSSVRFREGAVEIKDDLAAVPGVQVSIVVRGNTANRI